MDVSATPCQSLNELVRFCAPLAFSEGWRTLQSFVSQNSQRKRSWENRKFDQEFLCYIMVCIYVLLCSPCINPHLLLSRIIDNLPAAIVQASASGAEVIRREAPIGSVVDGMGPILFNHLDFNVQYHQVGPILLLHG